MCVVLNIKCMACCPFTPQIWDINNGAGYTSIEPEEGDINDVCVWPDSGEGPKAATARRGGVTAFRG